MKIGAAFYQAGLRKGQTVEFVIPNNSHYHVIVFAAWLCEAIVSLSDPEMSVPILKNHVNETKASFIICYDGSRSNVKSALEELGLMGKVKVVVLELACPKDSQDIAISEENFQFFKGKKSNLVLLHNSLF